MEAACTGKLGPAPCKDLGMLQLGDDVYERFRGIRRPGTNRLIGGGWPLQVGNACEPL